MSYLLDQNFIISSNLLASKSSKYLSQDAVYKAKIWGFYIHPMVNDNLLPTFKTTSPSPHIHVGSDFLIIFQFCPTLDVNYI